MVPAAVLTWAVAAWLVTTTGQVALGVALVAMIGAAVSTRWQLARPLALAAVCLSAVAASCCWRLATVESSPLAHMAQQGQIATMDVEVIRDARMFRHFGVDSSIVEVTVRRVVTNTDDVLLRDKAVAFIAGQSDDLVVGRRLTLRGRLGPSDDTAKAATISVIDRGVTRSGVWWWEASSHVREAVRRSVAHLPAEPRALVPALVDGDDEAVSDEVQEDFRRSGLTHLMAVSGTNVTIVLGVVMVLARAAGLRRRGLCMVGAVAIVMFVLVARPDPSVLRAAAMGAVGVAALGFGARGGVRALAWAVVGLLFVDPWLARTAGFILSVVATAGILLLAPAMAARLRTWMPHWCAVAVAVPLAAQLACTPALAALSGEVSLVAVFANIVAGPAVAPATVGGLAGGLAALIWTPVGQVFGTAAGMCTSWILVVGHRAAALDAASLPWAFAWQYLLIVVPIVAWGVLKLAARPAVVIGVSLGLVIGIWRPPTPGWPPKDWLMVACNVGQGDATVVNVGDRQAVVVDAGPDPMLVDRCLDRLGTRRVVLLVLTHAHADHVDGVAGVVRGRRVDRVMVGASGGPRVGRVPQHVAVAGEQFTVGRVTAQVLWPPRGEAAPNINDSSVVLRLQVRGVTLLLTGDIEPESQDALVKSGVDLTADVIKMPHHGSGRQSDRFFSAVGARTATISNGRDNDYGHPAAAALTLLRKHKIAWWRTDTDGDIAVVERDARVRVVTR